MATSILARRLAHPVQTGMLAKKPYVMDKRKEVYGLPEKGVEFMPLLLEWPTGAYNTIHKPVPRRCGLPW